MTKKKKNIKTDAVLTIFFNLFSVPRILFDQWTFNDYHIIFSSDTALQSLIDTIVSFLKVSCSNIHSYYNDSFRGKQLILFQSNLKH